MKFIDSFMKQITTPKNMSSRYEGRVGRSNHFMGNLNDAISSHFSKNEARIEKESWPVVLNLYCISFFGRKLMILKFKLNRCNTPICN
jgi:hypothetical protein